MDMEQRIRNARLMFGGLAPVGGNSPTEYADKQREYAVPETHAHVKRMARYGNDFFLARVQGIREGDPLGWEEFYIRMADVVRPSASITRRFDNYKAVIFADRSVDYIRPGTKFECMGSTWLCVNPMNVSGGDGVGIVQRCTTAWNHLDWYGNVLTEPMIAEPERADANDSDAKASNYLSKGYFNVTCQYNEQTAQIDTNTRMILGKGAWRVTGYADFLQEFTGDYDSRRLLSFTIRYDEPVGPLDDAERHVAGGKAFSWQIALSGTAAATVGADVKFEAASLRCGESAEGTAEHPVSYVWSSSDESVATVDENGLAHCAGPGTAVISAALAQNPEIIGSMTLTVEESGSETGVKFTSTVPEEIFAFEDATLSAGWFENGTETEEALEFSFSGAAEGSYRAVTGPGSVTIFCYGYSETPLTVTARHGEYSESATIVLGGF